MGWDEASLIGPEDEDWRVPVSELAARQQRLSRALREAGMSGALIQNPVDLYYFAGGRQNASILIPAESTEGDGPIQFVRRSLRRARWEAGGDDAPHEVVAFPRLSELAATLAESGLSSAPALQLGSIPSSFAARFKHSLSEMGGGGDCTRLIHSQREVKSDWEIDQMRVGAKVQLSMFEALSAVGEEGMTELELVATAEAVSRASGYGGNIQIRRFPMQCDRGVIVAGRAGGVPSFFDAAVGGTGPHPMASLGAGFNKVKAGEPVLVDLLHNHRGYIVDMTRMFSHGPMDEIWTDRLEDMLAVKDVVVDVLDQGRSCADAWQEGHALAAELGHADHLMGMAPDQAKFLGHSLGLELDESPVVAAPFGEPLPIGGTMAIEPKVVHPQGSVGSEDTWVRTEDGMIPITADGAFPFHFEW